MTSLSPSAPPYPNRRGQAYLPSGYLPSGYLPSRYLPSAPNPPGRNPIRSGPAKPDPAALCGWRCAGRHHRNLRRLRNSHVQDRPKCTHAGCGVRAIFGDPVLRLAARPAPRPLSLCACACASPPPLTSPGCILVLDSRRPSPSLAVYWF